MVDRSKQSFVIPAIFLLIIFILVIGFLIPDIKKSPVTQTPEPMPTYTYNIKTDGLTVTYGTVKANQSLSNLLSEYVSVQGIDRIAKESRKVFDLRKIRAGSKYALISGKDSAQHILFFIYEMNDVEFVVYDFRDSIRVYRDKKKVTKQVKTVEGMITTSLWNAFSENRLDVTLGMNLADVYAWTIDFYGLQKGDHFKVIYEEYSVENVSIRTDRILASVFTSEGKDFYAFYFEKDGRGEYFDETGQSMRRSFLKAPLRFSRISSRYSKSRMHPILRIARPHFGVDYAAPRGTPVVALGDGRIIEAGWHGGFGRFVSLRHNTIYTSTYAHLSKYASGIQPGVRVKQGDVIGYVGSSGLSTGAHLDFRVYRNGRPTDPLKLESPAADPIDPTDKGKYKEVVTKMKTELDKGFPVKR